MLSRLPPATWRAPVLRARLAFSSVALSPRASAEVEDAVLGAARSVVHPDGSTPSPSSPLKGATIGSLGFVKTAHVEEGTSRVVVDVAVPFPASPSASAILRGVEETCTPAALAAAKRAGSSATPVVAARAVPARHAVEALAKAGPGLAQVGSVVAVSSCKGGVGKSTVAVNLAFALQARGSRTALLDTDIHGPSLPTMVTPPSLDVRQKEGSGTVNPLRVDGVSCMSYGWVSRKNERGERGGAVMRGPMVSQVVGQLLRLTEWGEQDHLVLDMPPGTGDVQLTLGQTVPITGAVIVTTPQKLAVVDVLKGLDMFAALKVPTLAVVLNMAHYDAPDTGKRYYPFGTGGLDRVRAVMERHGVSPERLFTFPLDAALSEAGDKGVPEVLANSKSPISRIYDELAKCVAADVERRVLGARVQAAGLGGTRVTARFDPARGIVLRLISESGAREVTLSPARVRRACKCAACVDEMTNEQRLKPESVPETVVPKTMTETGNYGVAVTWSDGHASSIYTYAQLAEMGAAAEAGLGDGKRV
jgi:Mrp family chromosome partitioning ATPase/DUF971 family protein